MFAGFIFTFSLFRYLIMLEVLIIVIGLIVIAGFGIIIFRLKPGSQDTSVADTEALRKQAEELNSAKITAEERSRMLEQQNNAIQQQLKEKEALINGLNSQLSRKTTENEGLNEKLSTLKKDIEKLQDNFRNEFKNLANDILEEKTKKFTEQNRTKLDEILKPLSEKIREFEKKVEDTYDKESKQRFSLEKEIKNLAELNQQIS